MKSFLEAQREYNTIFFWFGLKYRNNCEASRFSFVHNKNCCNALLFSSGTLLVAVLGQASQ
jgi:hypothetical protein